MRKAERTTNQVAADIGVAPDLLRKWKARGLLKLAPQGVPGQGRGIECHWSEEAVAEARTVAETRKATRPRTRGSHCPASTPDQPSGLSEAKPVRLQLSRKKGFDLQALSLATNGLTAVKVARPGPFGNPFSVQEAADVFESNREASHRYAVGWFRDWINCPADSESFEPMCTWDGTQKQHRRIHECLPELRGKNLACFCHPDFECHADVLLDLANGPTPVTPPSPSIRETDHEP